jgi:hypothetical protein
LITWNKSRKRNQWGVKKQADRPASDIITVPAPSLQIIDDGVWTAAHARLAVVRGVYMKATNGRAFGRPALGVFLMFSWRDQAYYQSDPWRGKWATEGGGVLVNQSPHQLDLLRWFLGDVEEVSGYWANLNHPYIEVEDTAVATVVLCSVPSQVDALREDEPRRAVVPRSGDDSRA